MAMRHVLLFCDQVLFQSQEAQNIDPVNEVYILQEEEDPVTKINDQEMLRSHDQSSDLYILLDHLAAFRLC